MRIVSLIASATEIVAALGLEVGLVGRSHECDFPPSVRKLPVCTAPRFDVNGSSREIDERVKALLPTKDGSAPAALSVYQVDADLLRRLRPDVILTQTQCEVCAVSLKDVEAALCSWIDTRPRIVSLAPNTLQDVLDDVARVGVALGAQRRLEEVMGSLRGRLDAISAKARQIAQRPGSACLEWLDPLMAAGNWMPELVEMAGGVNLFGQAGKHSPWMSWEDLRAKDPDIIVALPCGFDLERTRQEMTALTRRPDWLALKAVRQGRVYVTDGNQFFNRPGPRLVESLEILAEIIHPEAFRFGHERAGWERFHV
jgi:iron complex transport system substrate-binding protein